MGFEGFDVHGDCKLAKGIDTVGRKTATGYDNSTIAVMTF